MVDLISLADLTGEEITYLLDRADALKAGLKRGEDYQPLAGQTLAMIFEKPSLRTRVTFETGMYQLGGMGLVLQSAERLGERETVADVARNLERWVDGVMARTFSHDAVVELAERAGIPVINALTDKLHPCQILADAQTLRENKGALEGLKVAFVGDGNNVCASWFNLALRLPIQVTLVCPPGFEVSENIRDRAEREGRGEVAVTSDAAQGLANADAVYTDVWASMGQEHERQARMDAFRPYQVNADLMAKAKPDALFMHCLPAKRGLEVTDEVIDGPASVAFDQAENRLHAQKAVLEALMTRDPAGRTEKSRLRSR